MKRKVKVLWMAIFLLINIFSPVKAEEVNLEKKGSITINLIDLENQQPIADVQLAFYYVAYITSTPAKSFYYEFTEQYKDCGVSIEDFDLTLKLNSITNDTSPSFTLVTDSQGNACVTDLPLGMYFVKQINTIEGYAACNPFIVTVPNTKDGSYVYDVNATPKTEIKKLISICIKKQWEADENASIPNEVTIQLFKDDVVVETAVLNSQNNWEIVFDNMPKSDSYSVKEINIPDGFTPIYEQNEYVFTVTNVSSLINTGQLVWPIPVLAFIGIALIALGFVFVRKSGNVNG